MVAIINAMKKEKVEHDYFIGVRITRDQKLRLGALARRSRKSISAVIRELIEKGEVIERVNQDHIQMIRQLTGEAVNLNQLARKANTFGFHEVAKRNEALAGKFEQIIKGIHNDG